MHPFTWVHDRLQVNGSGDVPVAVKKYCLSATGTSPLLLTKCNLSCTHSGLWTLDSRRSGQAILETFIAVLLLCLVLFGILQVLLVYNARTLAHHAAARTARSRSVGLNEWMQEKVMRVASIPASGRMTYVDGGFGETALPERLALGERIDRAIDVRNPLPPSAQTMAELEAISLYMTTRNHLVADSILSYEAWDEGWLGMRHWADRNLAHVAVWNRYPLEMPFHRLFYAPWDDAVTVRGEAAAIEHHELYLDGLGW